MAGGPQHADTLVNHRTHLGARQGATPREGPGPAVPEVPENFEEDMPGFLRGDTRVPRMQGPQANDGQLQGRKLLHHTDRDRPVRAGQLRGTVIGIGLALEDFRVGAVQAGYLAAQPVHFGAQHPLDEIPRGLLVGPAGGQGGEAGATRRVLLIQDMAGQSDLPAGGAVGEGLRERFGAGYRPDVNATQWASRRLGSWQWRQHGVDRWKGDTGRAAGLEGRHSLGLRRQAWSRNR